MAVAETNPEFTPTPALELVEHTGVCVDERAVVLHALGFEALADVPAGQPIQELDGPDKATVARWHAKWKEQGNKTEDFVAFMTGENFTLPLFDPANRTAQQRQISPLETVLGQHVTLQDLVARRINRSE